MTRIFICFISVMIHFPFKLIFTASASFSCHKWYACSCHSYNFSFLNSIRADEMTFKVTHGDHEIIGISLSKSDLETIALTSEDCCQVGL